MPFLAEETGWMSSSSEESWCTGASTEDRRRRSGGTLLLLLPRLLLESTGAQLRLKKLDLKIGLLLLIVVKKVPPTGSMDWRLQRPEIS